MDAVASGVCRHHDATDRPCTAGVAAQRVLHLLDFVHARPDELRGWEAVRHSKDYRGPLHCGINYYSIRTIVDLLCLRRGNGTIFVETAFMAVVRPLANALIQQEEREAQARVERRAAERAAAAAAGPWVPTTPLEHSCLALKASQLKEKLRNKNLGTHGNKRDLAKRLADASRADAEAAPALAT